MTYCVALLVDTGLVMLSDSRTNAGVDQINTFRKMATFQRPNDRVLVLMSAGNLAITQAVVNLLHEAPEDPDKPARIYAAKNMFSAARVIGDALREIHQRDADMLKEQGHGSTLPSFSAVKSTARNPACSTSTPPATSSSRPSTRPTSRSASPSTANPLSTASFPAAAAWLRQPSAR